MATTQLAPPVSAAQTALKRPRSRLARSADGIFKHTLLAFGGVVVLVLGTMLVRTTYTAWPAFTRYGIDLFAKETWAPSAGAFGGASFIAGTVITAAIAIVLAVPVALGIALCLNELTPGWLRSPLTYLVDLLAAIPSVIYGLWGVFVLVPLMQDHLWPAISGALGWIPLFASPTYGQSVGTAGLILAIMILPIVTAISREVIALTPHDQKEAALALGATRWETIRLAILPHARSGLVGGTILGLGRAMGETVAVALVIGGTPQIAASLFQPGYTIASVIANQFNEATGFQIDALVALGVILFAISILVNLAGRLFVERGERALR
jgi:phosphate transport system permease protein